MALPQLKKIVSLNAVSAANGATVAGNTNLIDLLGFDWCTIDVIATTADVVSNKPTVCKLQESDVTLATNSTSWSDVTAFATPTIPNANTAATSLSQNIYTFNVDARTRKRYMQAVYSPQTTQTVTIIANMGRGEQSPVTAAKANVMTLVEG